MKAEIIEDKLVIFPTSATEIYAMNKFLEWNQFSIKDLITVDTKEYLDAED